jgi:hypothetical protein
MIDRIGEQVMSEQQKDTSPLVKPTRHKQTVRIQEINNPPSSLFDVTVEYPSDDLPEWFKPLQSIVEDDTFTSMDIHLGDRVCYHISIVDKKEYDHSLFPFIRRAEDGTIRMREG